MKSIQPIRSSYWLIIAALALFVMAASSPQCARSADVGTNPVLDAQAAGGNDCIQNCNDEAKAAKAFERARHRTALRLCLGDSECETAEKELNTKIKQEINEDNDKCKAEVCGHEQGTAVGGQ